MIRIGLVGAGAFGRRLGGVIKTLPELRLVGVHDMNQAAAGEAADELGVPKLDSFQALLDDSEVDAVVIATPTFTHLPLCVGAIEAGKSVFCEKPMALTVGDCDQMIAAAAHGQVKLYVGHMQRLLPIYQAIQSHLISGRIGSVVSVAVERREFLRRSTAWLTRADRCGGILYQTATHDFDLLRSWFGDVDRVFSQAAGLRIQQNLDFSDSVQTSLRFSNGIIAQYYGCMSDRSARFAGSITGTLGTLEYDTIQGRIRISTDAECVEEAWPGGTGPALNRPGWETELRHFARWLQFGETPVVTAWDGRQAVAIAEAAVNSAAQGVPVSMIP